jgi:hypothetical protein
MRIESSAFSSSGLKRIAIPRSVEILGVSCFSSCQSLDQITFESNSRLMRIENSAFSSSGLKRIEIPRSVEILGVSCFSSCRSLVDISFPGSSSLRIIESSAFASCSLSHFPVPRGLEIMESFCFSECQLLQTLIFESHSHLKRIESSSFSGTSLHSVQLPARVCFIAADAIPRSCSLTSESLSSSVAFLAWDHERRNGSPLPFEKDAKPRRGLPTLPLDVRVLKTFPRLTIRQELDSFMTALSSLLAMRHPCISPLAGVAPQTRLAGPAIGIAMASQGTLSEIIQARVYPEWLTPTAKAIILVGIVLAMTYAHDCNVVHGSLCPNCIALDGNHRPIVCDFGNTRLSAQTAAIVRKYTAPESGLMGKDTKKADVFAFALMLYQVVADDAVASARGVRRWLAMIMANGEPFTVTKAGVPDFVSKLIAGGLAENPAQRPSFEEILDEFEENEFRIVAGVDTNSVDAFAIWVEESRRKN